MSNVILTPYIKPATSIPPFPYYAVSAYLPPTSYDTAAKIIALSDGQLSSNVNGDTIALNAGIDEYMYLFSPVSNGAVTFRNVSTNLVGGWDGASWGDGDIGEEFGPVVVPLDFGSGVSNWYVYRTDFSGTGAQTFSLTYAR
jgi:hypothetical protein